MLRTGRHVVTLFMLLTVTGCAASNGVVEQKQPTPILVSTNTEDPSQGVLVMTLPTPHFETRAPADRSRCETDVYAACIKTEFLKGPHGGDVSVGEMLKR